MHKEIPLRELEPNKFNPNTMPPKTFETLVRDMKTSGPKHDFAVAPIVVSPKAVFYNDAKSANGYVIVDGENRFKAAAEAGWDAILCEVRNISEDTAKALNYRRNKERGCLDPLKEAALFKLETEKGLTQEQVASKYNVSRPYVANRLGLIQLDKKVVEAFRQPEEAFRELKVEEHERDVQNWEKQHKEDRYRWMEKPEAPTEDDFVPRGTISASHLEAISTLPADKQAELTKGILEHDWTIRETERRVQLIKEEMAREKRFKEALEQAVRKKCPKCGSDPEDFSYTNERLFKCSKPNCFESWDFMKSKKEVEAKKESMKTEADRQMVERMEEARKNPSYIRSLETPEKIHEKVAPWLLRKIQQLTEVTKVSVSGKRGDAKVDINYTPPASGFRHMDLSFRVGNKAFGFSVQPKSYKKVDAKCRVDMIWDMKASEKTREALRQFFSEVVNTSDDPELSGSK